jgi:hypothetical protein
MKKLYLILPILFLFSFAFISALELNPFATSKLSTIVIDDDMSNFIKEDFNADYGVIRLSKTFFWIETDKLAEYSLTSVENSIINSQATGKATLYQSGKLFDDVSYKNTLGKSLELSNVQFYILTNVEYTEKEVASYKEVCEDIVSNDTKVIIGKDIGEELPIEEIRTQNCYQVADTYKDIVKTRQEWVAYNYEDLDAGDYEWKLEADRPINTAVDFIPTSFGKELNEWAWWNSSWNYKKPILLSTTTGATYENYQINMNITYDADMQTDFDDLRFANSTENGELSYWIESKIDSAWASVWVKIPTNITTTNQTIYMYYKNPTATTTSNGNNVFIVYDEFNDNSINTTKWQSYCEAGGTCNISEYASKYLIALQTTNLKAGELHSNYDFLSPTATNGYFYKANALYFSTGSTTTEMHVGYTQENVTLAQRDIFYAITEKIYGSPKSKTIIMLSNGTQYYSSTGIPDLSTGWMNQTMYWLLGNVTTHINNTYANTLTNAQPLDPYLKLAMGGITQESSGSGGVYVDWIFSGQYNPNVKNYLGTKENIGIGISLIYPTNNIPLTTQSNFNFTYSLTNLTGGNIVNVSLVINGNPVITNTSGKEGNYNMSYTFPTGFYSWYIDAYKSSGVESASTTYTINTDSSMPIIILNYPTALVNYAYLNKTLQLNITTTDTNLDKVWYNYNGTNVTLSGAVSGIYNVSNIILSNKKNVTIYANDTAGNLNTSVFSWDYKVFENSRTANNSSYETAYENYQINLTANSSLTAVTLDYNGTEYSLVNTIDGVWSYSRDLPSSVVGNNSVRYKFTYSGDTFYSDYSYQNVLPITFVACNATYATKFINFTFKDENTLANLNATMQTATWSYYLGSGTQSKSYVFTSATNASNHTFCASINRTFYATPSITYLATGYPARFYTPGVLTLTNTTTNTTLYLLASTDGIYVTFQTISSLNSPISGASVLITRLIAGATTTIGQGITDSAGAYTIWLNPNYDHVITASKTGFGSNSQTIRPTQSSYTLILTAAQNYTYVSDFSGLLWGIFPRGVVIDEATSFGFNISSIYGTIVKCKIELLSNNKSIVLASGETIAANGSYCTAITTYVPNAIYPQMKGRLLIDTGNGYEILEEDAYWRRLNYNTTGLTFTDWFNSMNSTNLDLSYFNNDEQHREYTNILIFFLIVMIICASLNSAGWDIQTSGGMIFLVGILVWIASVPGFLMLSDISPYQFVDQYFVAIIYTMFMIGFGSRSFN